MGLQAVARAISHYATTQRSLVLTIRAIGSGRPTFSELRSKTGLKERYLRYIITLLRTQGIVKGERGEAYCYRLAPDAYAQFVKLQLIKAIENASNGRDEE